MNKHGTVGVRAVDSGEERVCGRIDPGGGYGTLCGTSLDDDLFEDFEVPFNARITCVACRGVWDAARAFRASDFAV